MYVELPPQLFIVGLGVTIPEHVTTQAKKAMSQCSKLYSIVQEIPRLWLPTDAYEKIEVVNALDFYIEGSLRTQNYDRAAQAIIEECGAHKTLGYVTYGNPMAYDSVAKNLVRLAAKSGVSIRIIPGISSVDTIMCDLKIDIAPGIQVYEASWLLACQIEPRTDVQTLLLQMGSFGSFRTHYSSRQGGNSLVSLVEYLSTFYPRSHFMALVRSTGDESQPANIRQINLGALCDVTPEDLSGASLYIPTLDMPRINPALLNKMVET